MGHLMHSADPGSVLAPSARPRTVEGVASGIVSSFRDFRDGDAAGCSPANLERTRRCFAMLDVVMIALGVGFFVASVLYVIACERM